MRYPAVELCTAILTALVVIRFGFTAESMFAVIFTWFLIVIALIDYDTQLIPDLLSLPLLWIGLALSLFHPVTGSQVLFVAPKDAIVGALAGYLSLWSVYHVFRMLTGKEGMGYGDFKLLAAIGAWIGYQSLPLVILLSAFVGAVVGVTLIALKRQSRETPMPFGPYLAAAGWFALLYGDEIVDMYFRLVLQTG
jgi:leader peptidase (prepilin peptidase)/N-methyltransferase